jgi:hypothetical protein
MTRDLFNRVVAELQKKAGLVSPEVAMLGVIADILLDISDALARLRTTR